MSVLDNTLLASASTSISDFLNPRLWMTNAVHGQMTDAGVQVNPTSALALPTYYSCLQILSEDVSKLPLGIRRRIGENGTERAADVPAASVLRRPNGFQSQMQWRTLVQQWAAAWGNGFSEIVFQGADPTLLVPIHPSRVTVEREQSGAIMYHVTGERGGKTVDLTPDRMFHLRNIGDELLGWSVASLGSESIGLSLAAQKYGANFYGNGAHIGGILTHPGELGGEAHDRLKEDIKNFKRDGQWDALIAEEGMEWKAISVPPNEAQFIEARGFQIEEVCRWFRMPPIMVGHKTATPFTNVNELFILYVTNTLGSWTGRWEDEIDRKLFPGDNEDLFAEHDVSNLLRGDPAMRSKFNDVMFKIGSISRNEIRRREGLPPVNDDEGDQFYRPSNLTRIGDEPEAMSVPFTGASPFSTPAQDDEDDDENRADATDKAFVCVFSAAAERIVVREAKAIRNAVRRYAGDGAAFSAWCDRFFEEQAKLAEETLAPHVSAYAMLAPSWRSSSCGAPEWLTGWCVGRSASMRVMVLSQRQADDLDRYCTGLTLDGPQQIAAELIGRLKNGDKA